MSDVLQLLVKGVGVMSTILVTPEEAESHLKVVLLQLKITYSRHRDLNVKGNNDKSADYTGGILGTPSPQVATGASAPTSNVIPASAYQGPGADLLMGGYGGAISMTEASPSGLPSIMSFLPATQIA